MDIGRCVFTFNDRGPTMRTSSRRVRTGLTRAGLATLLLLAACGGDDASPPSDTEEVQTEFSFGEPAEASAADRTIQLDATSPFAFDPADLTVAVGETITFEVTNTDAVAHDLLIGDQDAQDEHEAEMREMEEMDAESSMEHGDVNALEVPAGETASITWTFTEAGTVLYGCHEPGHYAAGMVGEITVEG